MQTFSNTPTSTSTSGCPSLPTGGSAGGVPGTGSGTNRIYYTFSGSTFARTTATRCWTCSSGGTPSGSTGPSTGGTISGPQVAGNRYLYCETSSPNNPTVTFGATVWSASSTPSGGRIGFFVTYAYGATIGTFQGRFIRTASTTSSSGTSHATVSITGQQQTNGTSNWNTNAKAYTQSSSGYAGISLYYQSGTSFTGDMAVDYLFLQDN